MTDAQIAAIGAYTPRLRIVAAEFDDAWGSFNAAGVKPKAVPEADEAALHVGVAAGERAPRRPG